MKAWTPTPHIPILCIYLIHMYMWFMFRTLFHNEMPPSLLGRSTYWIASLVFTCQVGQWCQQCLQQLLGWGVCSKIYQVHTCICKYPKLIHWLSKTNRTIIKVHPTGFGWFANHYVLCFFLGRLGSGLEKVNNACSGWPRCSSSQKHIDCDNPCVGWRTITGWDRTSWPCLGRPTQFVRLCDHEPG